LHLYPSKHHHNRIAVPQDGEKISLTIDLFTWLKDHWLSAVALFLIHGQLKDIEQAIRETGVKEEGL
jgi:hypothetical protein